MARHALHGMIGLPGSATRRSAARQLKARPVASTGRVRAEPLELQRSALELAAPDGRLAGRVHGLLAAECIFHGEPVRSKVDHPGQPSELVSGDERTRWSVHGCTSEQAEQYMIRSGVGMQLSLAGAQYARDHRHFVSAADACCTRCEEGTKKRSRDSAHVSSSEPRSEPCWTSGGGSVVNRMWSSPKAFLAMAMRWRMYGSLGPTKPNSFSIWTATRCMSGPACRQVRKRAHAAQRHCHTADYLAGAHLGGDDGATYEAHTRSNLTLE